MLIFDGLAAIALVVAVVSWLFRSLHRRGWAIRVATVGIGFLLLHIGLEGIRWQMAGVYLVAVISVGSLAWCWGKQPEIGPIGWLRVSGRALVGVAGVIILGSSWFFSWLFPMFDVPEPSGPYAAGLTEIHMVDTGRPERHTEDLHDNRQLMVQVWYPATSATDRERVPYWRHPSIYSREVGKSLSLPPFVFSHLRLIHTQSYWNAPLPNDVQVFPVIIFSHGFGMGWSGQNVSLMQTLASHGYVVFSIDHPYAGAASVFPDGTAALLDETAFPRASGPPNAEAMAMYAKLMASTDWREQVSLLKQMDTQLPAGVADAMDAELDVWVEDQSFVLKQAQGLQAETVDLQGGKQLAGRLDLDNVAIFGMSFGGSASLEHCAVSPRCKAGANLDGFVNRHTQLPPLERPFLFMNSESNYFYNAVYEYSNGPAYAVSIEGSQHMNFTDLSVIAPGLKSFGVLGAIEGDRMQEITNRIVTAFFDEHLQGPGRAGWSDIDVSEYPETKILSKWALAVWQAATIGRFECTEWVWII